MAGAAAQAVAAPAPSAAPVSPLSEGSDAIGLSDALAQLEPPSEEAAVTPDAPDAPAQTPAAKTPAGPALDPLSAEAIAAPGGIEKAQAFLKEKQRDHDRKYLKLDEREKRFNHDKGRHLQELEQSRAYVQSVQADLQLLRRGNADQKLEALGRLSQGDGLEVWKDLAISAANGGAKPPSADVLELKAQLQQLQQKIDADKAADHERGVASQLNQLRGQMLHGAQQAAEQFPALAHFATAKPAEVTEYLNDMIVNAHSSGQPMTWAQAYAQLNAELAPHLPTAPAVQGLATLTAPPAAKPVAPTQRSPGRSLNPSLATRPGGAVREMTEAERIAELASDPDFISSLF